MFSQAISDLFTDPNLARDAFWYVGGVGAAVPVRIILRQPDRIASFGETRIAAATMVFEVRASEAPTLAEGDTIEVDGEAYIIQGEPIRDAARLVWTAEARPA